MSLYFGNMLVAGRGPHIVMCESMSDYQNKISSWGMDAFYYVPPGVKEVIDTKGLRISLVASSDGDDQAGIQGQSAKVRLVCEGAVPDEARPWNGLQYTFDGKTWTKLDESSGGPEIELNAQRPEAYVRAVPGGNRAFRAGDGSWSRRLVLCSDATPGGVKQMLQIDGDYLYLLSSDYDGILSNSFTYGGQPCVFTSAFAGSDALFDAADLPVPGMPGDGNVLQALSATPSCYMGMFAGCVNLMNSPVIGDPMTYCYDSAQETYVSSAAPARDSFSEIFKGCGALSSVQVSFTKWIYEHEGGDENSPEISVFTDWLDGVAAQGNLQAPSALLADEAQEAYAREFGYIPGNWTSSWNESEGEDEGEDDGAGE